MDRWSKVLLASVEAASKQRYVDIFIATSSLFDAVTQLAEFARARFAARGKMQVVRKLKVVQVM